MGGQVLAVRVTADRAKERPILFSGPMVRAILDGRKTQTRRLVKLTDSGRVKEPGSPRNWHLDDHAAVNACPFGRPGDRLWVRETFRACSDRVLYAATEERPMLGWEPSIFMPRKWSRLTLEITDVRVQRLQEISEQDATAEGLGAGVVSHGWQRNAVVLSSAVGRFRMLWDQINGKRAPWESNPWAWAITFRRADREDGCS